MPVSDITNIITWAELILQMGISTVELGVLTYLVFFDGWLDMIRLISFWLDKTIIKYIDQFYKYFEKILAGEIFSPTVMNNVMKNVYIFVALIVLLKLLLLFMKYLANPEMVSDDKVGAQALVKRFIIGMCGMLSLPMIFNFAISLQKAILNDNLFGKLLLDKHQLAQYEQNKHQMGRMLAFNVYQAFWNMDKTRVTSRTLLKEYDDALLTLDPGVIDSINEKYGSDYAYDYFPIASCIVLIYVIYLVIKYCLDVVVRMFKLFLLQMVGPLAISDYMVNGDSKEVFKNWLKTSLSVYAMLFVRIFSIWFIAFIMILMQGTCTHFEKDPNTGKPTEICADESLLYIAPGEEPDYLLRGIITLGLLALLMDLPKFFSDLFGLDLEQDATVKGIMQKAGSAAKGVGMAGLAVGGAAIGGAISTAKQLGSAGINLASGRLQNKGKLDGKIASQDSNHASLLGRLNNGNKDERKQARRDLKKSRKDYIKNNKNSDEVKQYKAGNRKAVRQGLSMVSVGAGGISHAALTGVMKSAPLLSNVSSGYNQGQSAVNNQAQSSENRENALQNHHEQYKKGVELAVNDVKLDKEIMQFEAEALVNEIKADGAKTATEKVEMTGQVNKIETASSEKPVFEMTGQVNKVETASSEKPVFEMTGQVNEVNVQNVGRQTIDVAANVTTDDQNKTQ